MLDITVAQILEVTQGACSNCSDLEMKFSSFHPLDNATPIPNSIAFIKDKKYLDIVNKGVAGLIITTDVLAKEISNSNIVVVIVNDPYVSFAKISQLLDNTPKPKPGIHPTAVVPNSTKIGANVHIGPYVVLGENCIIADEAVISAHCCLGDNCKIGERTYLHPHVVLYHDVFLSDDVVVHSKTVLGADGFGYANEQGRWIKIPQVGTTIIGSRTEIGALTSIDRGALKDTIVENDVIIDNHVHLGHNVKVGKGTAMAGGTIVAGSTTFGNYCIIGGASVFNGHINIADFVTVTGMSMVPHSLTESHKIYSSGIPVDDNKKWLRSTVMLKYDYLKDQSNRIKSLELQIKDLLAKLEEK